MKVYVIRNDVGEYYSKPIWGSRSRATEYLTEEQARGYTFFQPVQIEESRTDWQAFEERKRIIALARAKVVEFERNLTHRGDPYDDGYHDGIQEFANELEAENG